MFENLLTFANQIRIGMETITLSFDPNSDFAVALDELIRKSEGVRVVKRSRRKESVGELIKEIVENAPQDAALTDEDIQQEVNSVRYCL